MASKILIVEDQPVVALDIKESLKEFGYEVTSIVSSGAESIKRVEHESPDAVLMDIHLSDEMDGIEVADKIYSRFKVPVIFLTAFTDAGLISRAKKVGAFGYLVKPFEARELYAMIEMALYKARTEREIHEAREALKNKDLLNQMLLDALPCVALLLRPGTREIVVSNATGKTVGALPGKTCYGTWGQRNDPCPWCLAPEALEKGKPQHKEVHALETIWDAYWYPVDENLYLHYAFDITEKRKMELQHQQTRKLEALGALAGGIAHEFNNALSVLIGNIELLEMDLPYSKEIKNYCNDMKQSSWRMAELTSQLLAYSQRGKYLAEIIDVNDLVINALSALKQNLAPSIEIKTVFSKGIFRIKADRTQMNSVLSAIVNNSAEAIGDKGLIKIIIRDEFFHEEPSARYPGIKPGSYVCLTIEDDGSGMNQDCREKIFEPFFSTKFQGRGLGMAAVYGIVRNHSGWIFVESEVHKGTSIKIYLPAFETEQAALETTQSRKLKHELIKGTGTILVIEDEDLLLKIFRESLPRLGYKLLEANTGKEAIHTARTFDGKIDLVVLDIKLPDMDGEEIYPVLKEIRPGLKVIVCSGYSYEDRAKIIMDAGGDGYIQKPFLISELSSKIKEVLDKK